MKGIKAWKIRRRSLLVGALIVLVIFVGIHLASDASVGGVSVGGGIDEDVNSQAGLPSNMNVQQSPAVSTSILSATSILGHHTDIYLDGTLPSLT